MEADLIAQAWMHYRGIVELISDYAYAFRVEPDGTIICEWATEGFERLTGYTPQALLAQGGYDLLIHPDDRHISQRRTEALLRGESVNDQFRIITRAGEVRWLKDAVRPELDDIGRVVRLYGAARDVTERRLAVAALRDTRQELESILANSQDGVVLLDEQGRIALWTSSMERMTGIAAQAAVGSSLMQIIVLLQARSIDDPTAPPQEQALQEWIHTGRAPWAGKLLQGQIILQDGNRRTVESSSFQIHTAKGWRVGCVVRDVTERAEMEQVLRESERRYRDLVSHTRRAVEDERARISREIHDELGQTLTALSYDVHWLLRRLKRTSLEVKEKLGAMLAQIDLAIGGVQELARALRPHLLDDLGLTAAVEWQVQQYAERTGLLCDLIIEPEELVIDSAPAIALFRILQEALTNVARHARATRVEIVLRQDVDGVQLVVRDNGRGITPEEAHSSDALGLIGMRERAERWGGWLCIEGEAGKGTTVSVHIRKGGMGNDSRVCSR